MIIESIMKYIPVNSSDNNKKNSSIPNIYERLKDANNKNKDLKGKIYYVALKIML